MCTYKTKLKLDKEVGGGVLRTCGNCKRSIDCLIWFVYLIDWLIDWLIGWFDLIWFDLNECHWLIDLVDWLIWFDLISFHFINWSIYLIWFHWIDLIWHDFLSKSGRFRKLKRWANPLAKVVDFEPLGAFFALGGLEADLTPIRRSHRIHVHYENIVIPC